MATDVYKWEYLGPDDIVAAEKWMISNGLNPRNTLSDPVAIQKFNAKPYQERVNFFNEIRGIQGQKVAQDDSIDAIIGKKLESLTKYPAKEEAPLSLEDVIQRKIQAPEIAPVKSAEVIAPTKPERMVDRLGKFITKRLGGAETAPSTVGNVYGEETIYSPEGVPLSVSPIGPEAGPATKAAAQLATGVVSAPVSAVLGAAKPIVGGVQLASKLIQGKESVGDEAAKTAEMIGEGIKQQAGPASWITSRPAEFIGEVAGPLQLKFYEKSAKAASAIKGLPEIVKNMAGLSTAAATTGAIMPQEAGKTREEFVGGVAKEAAVQGVVGAAVPLIKPVVKYTASQVGNLTSHVLGMTTGVGGDTIKEAYRAGVNKFPEFWSNLTGKADKTQVLDDAKRGLSEMQKKLSEQYRSGMVDIKADKSILDFKGIDRAIAEAETYGRFKGQVQDEDVIAVVQKAKDKISEWKALDPKEFHTPEGMDALKKAIGSILDKIGYDPKQKNERAAIEKIYASLKNEITQQAPVYSSVMKNYSEGSDAIMEIQKALSLGKKSSEDTALRKLQSVMRNNVNTNYGRRVDLAKQLEEEGGVRLMPSLAGQALSSPVPRGLAAQGGGLATLPLAYAVDPTLAAALPFQSPRAVGAMAYGLGKIGGALTPKTSQGQRISDLLYVQSLLR